MLCTHLVSQRDASHPLVVVGLQMLWRALFKPSFCSLVLPRVNIAGDEKGGDIGVEDVVFLLDEGFQADICRP